MPKCPTCNDTGYVIWEKPIGGLDHLVVVPMTTPCVQCEAGRNALEVQTQFNQSVTPTRI